MTDSVDGVTEYTYDAQGQLLTEQVTPVGVDQATRTTVMTYDGYGNILTKTTSIRAVTDDTVTDGTVADDTETNNNITTATDTYEYTCTWKDKLTAINGVPIVYDNLGNPISYLGHNLTWEKGRQLLSFDKNNYTYNANGIRTSKEVDGVKHTYQLDGTKILKETWGDCTLIPLYDNEDSVCGIIYDDAPYYFYKNLQGDIIEIANKVGTVVARYTYDAWGKVTAITDGTGVDISNNVGHVANANPFRYRGYYYDAEIGMYYLQSRYYDPVVGRFINADSIDYLAKDNTIISCNLFTYCQNSPTNSSDPSGYGPFLAIGIQFVVSIGKFTIGLEALWSTQNWKFYLFGFIGGSRQLNISSLLQTENALIEDIMYLIRSVPKFSISSFSIFKKLSISVSFVAVLGNKQVSFPKDYCGWFTGASFSIWHITASGAYSVDLFKKAIIGSIGLGVSTSKANVSFAQTYYIQLTGNNALKNNLDALRSGINNRLAFAKLFVCLF